MIRATRGTRFARILLLAVGVMAALSLGLAARSDWSYYPTNEASSNTLALTGTFNISSAGSASGFNVTIFNREGSLQTILWDESVMVLPSGESSKVIHTGVRIIDKAAPQAPTSIAPYSRATEAIWPITHVRISKYLSNSSVPLSLWNNCTISLYLTIQDASGKTTENWTWVFTEVPRKPINWWLWIGIFFGIGLIGMILDPE